MPRGGYREGAGGKPKWKSGKTKVIRVPEVLADRVLDYARELDEGKIRDIDVNEITSAFKLIDLSGVPTKLIEGEMAVRLSDLVKRGYQLLPSRINDVVLASIKNKKR